MLTQDESQSGFVTKIFPRTRPQFCRGNCRYCCRELRLQRNFSEAKFEIGVRKSWRSKLAPVWIKAASRSSFLSFKYRRDFDWSKLQHRIVGDFFLCCNLPSLFYCFAVLRLPTVASSKGLFQSVFPPQRPARQCTEFVQGWVPIFFPSAGSTPSYLFLIVRARECPQMLSSDSKFDQICWEIFE